MRAIHSMIGQIDCVFTATLTLGLLAGGTLAIGSAWFEGNPAAARQPQIQAAPGVAQLPVVEMTGKRVDRGPAWARTENTVPSISLISDTTAAPAHKLGEHPAIIARRVIAAQGYDYASKFYPHPAWLYLAAEAPRPMMDHPGVIVFQRAEQERAAALNAAAEALAQR